MLEAIARPFVQRKFVDDLAKYIANKAVSPNMVTLFAALLGLMIIPALVQGWVLGALGLLWGSGYLDMLDGSIARYGDSTQLGAVLDIIADRFVESAVIFGLFLVAPERAMLCLLMLVSVLLCVTSFLVVGIFTQNSSNKSFHYSPGLMERAEAFIFFSLMMIMPQYFETFAILFVVLLGLTTVIRIMEFAKACD